MTGDNSQSEQLHQEKAQSVCMRISEKTTQNKSVMKTVFDYYISQEEWGKIHGGMDKATYLSAVDNETATVDIATLFYLRGDKKRAADLSESLPPDVKNDLWRTLTHS